MRAFVRKEVNLERPIDVRKLKAWERLLVAIKYQYRESKMYKQKKQKEEEKLYRLQVAREERLKDSILMFLYGELVKNRTLSKNNQSCESVTLAIPRGAQDILDNVLRTRDFLSFDIRVIQPDTDFLNAFDDLPILVEFKKKTL